QQLRAVKHAEFDSTQSYFSYDLSHIVKCTAHDRKTNITIQTLDGNILHELSCNGLVTKFLYCASPDYICLTDDTTQSVFINIKTGYMARFNGLCHFGKSNLCKKMTTDGMLIITQDAHTIYKLPEIDPHATQEKILAYKTLHEQPLD